MTLLRSPFGRPLPERRGQRHYKKVSAVVSKHAVHIGWAIDSNDWMYQGESTSLQQRYRPHQEAGGRRLSGAS